MGLLAPEAWCVGVRRGKGGTGLGAPCIGVLGRDFGIGMVTRVIA